MERLDLRQVEYFIAVAEELNFGRAARRLHLAQPSLSQQIRRLETQVGVPLLERTTRHVALTPAGTVFLREGRLAVVQAQRALAAARAHPAERLVVGFTGTAGRDLMTAALADLGRRRPTIDIVLRELELNAVEDILTGRVDVAFTRLAPGETQLELEILGHEARVAMLPADHALSSRPSIQLAELRDEQFITSSADNNPVWREHWLAEQRDHGLPGRVIAEATSIEQMVTLVATRRGVAVVPVSTRRLYPRPGVVYIDVVDIAPSTVSLAWRPGDTTPARQDLLASLRSLRDPSPDGTEVPDRFARRTSAGSHPRADR